MNNQPKYYTPSIEEFHVGFEFEFYDDDDNDWTRTILKTQSELCNWTALEIPIRVKHLDREDIESLGWKINGSRYFTLDKYDFWLDKNGMCDIHRKGDYDRECPSVTMKIKNKSELKRLMKQLEIIE